MTTTCNIPITKDHRPNAWKNHTFWEDDRHYWHCVLDTTDNDQDGNAPNWVWERRGLPIPEKKRHQLQYFDYIDTFILANTFTAPELRHELHHADVMAKVNDTFIGTPYANETPFPWADYAGCVREALECVKLAPCQPVKDNHRRINIQALKAGNDIVTVIERYTTLRKSGNNRFNGKCPLHDDKGPSLTVYAQSQSWHCFGACNKGGDVFDFIKAAECVDFEKAAAILGGL
jgi:hypothetical protein